jgi:hypothetical protein
LPEDPNIIPRLHEDEVVYDDLLPWPVAADGTGASLQRTSTLAYGNSALSWLAAAPTPGAFVSNETKPGDFDGDQHVDGKDLDLFCQALKQSSSEADYDLNDDGQLNSDDRDVMVRDILGTNYGDADLNGVFDSGDLVHVFQFGQYEDNVPGNSKWDNGDFNCDGDFDSGDLVLAFQGGAYVTDARPLFDLSHDRFFSDLASAVHEDDELLGPIDIRGLGSNANW